MNKKVILLMLALPLILMLSLFTTTNTVSLVISVPVSGIELHEDKVVYLDLEKTHEISYTVYPTNAANKEVTYIVEPRNGETPAQLNIENGKIIPQSCGTADVTVRTVDGGYQAKFIVSIFTNKLQGIESTVDSNVIKIGETTQIQTSFNPVNAPYSQRALGYKIIEGANAVSVSNVGKITGIGVGNAVIRVYCKVNEQLYSDVAVSVESNSPVEFQEKAVTNTLLQGGGEIAIVVDQSLDLNSVDVSVDLTSGDLSKVDYLLDLENKKLTYNFKTEETCEFTFKITVNVSGETFEDYCTVTRVSEISAEWTNGNVNAEIIYMGSSFDLCFEVKPATAEVDCTVTLSEDSIVTWTLQDGVITVTANENVEETTVTLYLTVTDTEGNSVTLEQIFVVLKPE